MNEPTRIQSVRINGFRSLKDFQIRDLPMAAVLIGANGSGKSNFVRFFEMMSWMVGPGKLEEFVQRQGGAADQLFGGSGVSPQMTAKVAIRTESGQNEYKFILTHAHPDRFIFTEEAFRYSSDEWISKADWQHLGSSHTEARLVEAAQSHDVFGVNPVTVRVIVTLLRRCSVFQFHDTSDSSGIKIRWDTNDSNYLRSNGGNLAAVLLRLEREDLSRYEMICRHITRVLPTFDRFDIEDSYDKVLLRWKGKWTDKTFGAHLTSDGSLRFFALTTLLNLPPQMLPDVLLLDEPELGLHPAAISLIGDMIKSLSKERQIIVATQSPLLVDAFDIGEITVLELRDGRTEVRILDEGDYQRWQDEYTTGELWQKNLLGGRP